MKQSLSVLTLLLAIGCQPEPPAADPPPDAAPPITAQDYPGAGYEGAAFEFERISDDIYQARGTGNVTVGSNASIVINENDVLVVDSHVSPVAAAALLEELRAITDKPVRYVVNSHFHFDHAHGNQIYPADVEVIGHEFTREMLMSDEATGRTYQSFLEAWADRPHYLEGQEGLVPTPPNLTLSERMTLVRGGREIQLHFFGRGHTGGDVVVYLPAERILMTGDLLLPFLPYAGDGFPVEWVETLEALKELDIDLVMPGHGQPFTDLSRIDATQAYLRDVWTRVSDAHARGRTAEQAAAEVDMTDHAEAWPQIQEAGVPISTVVRIYELLDGEG